MASSWWQRWSKPGQERQDRARARRAVARAAAAAAAACGLTWAAARIDLPSVKYLIAAMLGLVVWTAARALADALHVTLRHRTDPGAAGLAEFAMRLAGLLVALGLTLHTLGLQPRSLLLGGAITAGVFILTAREPLVNLVAGLMLAAARPFKVGDTIRLQGGNLAGIYEGRVVQLGLLFTVFRSGRSTTMMPNNLLITSSITPLEEIAAVDFEAILRPKVTPSLVQSVVEAKVTVDLNGPVDVDLVKLGEQVTVRISATPTAQDDGGILADQILHAIAPLTLVSSSGSTSEFEALLQDRDDG